MSLNASSEEHRLAVNGMSYSRRDSQNANTAVIVTVSPDDFGSDHPLAGVEFQRKLEEAAYLEGNGKVPVQLFGDFCENRPSVQLGTVTPHIKGMYQLANVRNIFPEFIAESLTERIRSLTTSFRICAVRCRHLGSRKPDFFACTTYKRPIPFRAKSAGSILRRRRRLCRRDYLCGYGRNQSSRNDCFRLSSVQDGILIFYLI